MYLEQTFNATEVFSFPLSAHKHALGFFQNAEKCREKVTAIEPKTIHFQPCEVSVLIHVLGCFVLGRQDYTIADTVLTAPRGSYPDIVKLTERNVQSGHMNNLKVVPGYYTVETDRGDDGRVRDK